MAQKVRCLTKALTCLMITIEHHTDDDPMVYINSIRNEKGIDQARNTLLAVVREFHNYHILTQSPHIYVSDIHCRNTDGMFAYFRDEQGSFGTRVRPMVSYWTPKAAPDAQDTAEAFFGGTGVIPIEELSIARARVYAERQHLSLAIIHAVMALEVVVPAFINKHLVTKGVSKSAVQDFNSKFGLSVRVKAILKTILPKSKHTMIDTAGQAIGYRNRILHEGLLESSLSSVAVNVLVEACHKLIQEIRSTTPECCAGHSTEA
ncbi:MAG TPA: hypothetical protein VNE39_16410 [Planctomycetota bacterium]|nr:hypothetical protein [Planctomycetota bacterium]